jgi:ABC-2 type transport system permease protein
MNLPSNTAAESHAGSQAIAPAAMPATRLLYWSIRRELWENRLVYIAPLAAAVFFLFAYLIHTIVARHRMPGVWTLTPMQQHDLLAEPYQIAGILIMGTAFILGIFYSVDALYGERRDRSILFWKSMPVSDLTTVLAKITIPVVVLPLLSFAITVVTQFLMLLLSSVVLLGTGLSFSTLWTESSFIHASVMLLYHILTVHGLWYAPLYGWLLLVSDWAPRAPFIWAFLPPFVIGGMEKLAFHSSHFLNMLASRVTGPEASISHGSSLMDILAALTPLQFLSTPGLWVGLAIAAAFLAAAVQLRRYSGPV